jgi:hypothetical protein
MNSPAPAPARNAPCSCGSGQRYKQCCGSETAAGTAPPPPYRGWEAFTPDIRAALSRKMQEALAAQHQHRLDTAGPLYEEVIALAPLTFDAVHMLGVVRLMEGDLDAAESLLTRARNLAPDVPSIQTNLRILAHRQQEHSGLYSVRAIVASDMLRLAGLAFSSEPPAGDPFAPVRPGTPYHIVIPGEATNAGSNQTGVALARRMGAGAVLWSRPLGDVPHATVTSARPIGEERAQRPAGGTLALFDLEPNSLGWLDAAAATFDAIVIGLVAHDPVACVDLFGRLSSAVVPRVRFVARSAALLEDLGLPGTVDPMLFDRVQPAPSRPRARPRVGVFIPSLRDREDAARWRMLEWLRAQPAFLRVLYPDRLPSPHVPNHDEHLIGLATQWDGWHDDLDALFFWGAEGQMRQYDRLVFEALAANLPVVADGYGDFGAALAARANCTPFFEPETARTAMQALLTRQREDAAAKVAA